MQGETVKNVRFNILRI